MFLLAGCSIAIAAGDTPPLPIELYYSPWIKFCQNGQDTTAKQVCFTGKDGRCKSGEPGVAAVIVESEGGPDKILRVTPPLGIATHSRRGRVHRQQPATAKSLPDLLRGQT
jgi:invasion protein IalB